MTSTGTEVTIVEAGPVIVRQADSESHLIDLWIANSNSAHTRRARSEDAARFLGFVAKPLALVTVGDLYAYAYADNRMLLYRNDTIETTGLEKKNLAGDTMIPP